jgi:hypothetical protein
MSEPISLQDVTDAARLLTLGMRPKLLPARDLIYSELVRRYGEDDSFKDVVESVAEGLGLTVLAVSPRTGVVHGAIDQSVFEYKFDDYTRRVSLGERRGLEKALHGLAHMAVAAMAFPRPDDLADDTYAGRVSVEQADSVVREACRALEEKSAAAEESDDPLEDAPQLEQVWRAYLRRPETARTKDGRLAPSTTRGILTKALRFLADQGFLVKVNDEYGGTYRTTPRYQVQVRELAAERAFAEFLELGVVRVTDWSGSLHVAPVPAGDGACDV